MQKHIEIKITGHVQGVFFRQTAKEIAKKLSVVGWVRNEPDGSTKIVAEGEEGYLRKLMEWRRKGTEYSKVENVKIEWREATNEFNNFEIL